LDKHSNRISITFNGKRTSTHESKEEEVDQQHKVNEYDQIRTEEVEWQEDKGDFPWVLPEDKNADIPKIIDIEKRRKHIKKRTGPFRKSPSSFSNKKKASSKSKFKWKFTLPNKWLAIVAAIVIGSGFGMLLLSLFTSFSLTPSQQSIAIPENEQPVIAGEQEETNSENKVNANLQETSVYVVQAGVFSQAESAQPMIDKLETDGFPSAAIKNDDSVYLFIGIGADQEVVKQIGSIYKDDGFEVYVKEYTIGGGEFLANDEKTVAFVESGQSLYEEMLAVTSSSLAGEPAHEESSTKLNDLFQQWQTNTPNEASAAVEKIESEMSAAYEALTTFQQSQAEAQLWKAQQSLLNLIEAYNMLVEAEVENS
jgi:stage II sporulation protein B